MPIIKFELPNDTEINFNSTQYFLYPRVTDNTDVKKLTYAGGGLDDKIVDKFYLGLKFV